MNLANVGTVEDFCASFTERAGRNDDVRTWLTKNLRKWLINHRGEWHVGISSGSDIERLVEDGALNSVPDWLVSAVERGDEVAYFNPASQAASDLFERINLAIDWMLSGDDRPDAQSISRVRPDHAIAAALAWHDRQSRARILEVARVAGVTERQATAMLGSLDEAIIRLFPEAPEDAVELASFAGGLRVVEVLTRGGLRREGTLMDHCVETYHERVAKGQCRILSVRDRHNRPLATAEVWNARSHVPTLYRDCIPDDLQMITQFQGVRNSVPPADAGSCMAQFMRGRQMVMSARYARRRGMAIAEGVADHVDLARFSAKAIEMLAADGSRLVRGPTPIVREAIELFSYRQAEQPQFWDQVVRLALPGPEDVERKVVQVTPTPDGSISFSQHRIPVGIFYLLDRAPAGMDISEEVAKLGRHILDEVSNAAGSLIEITFSGRAVASPDIFFAYCGLHSEWAIARTSMTAAARSRALDASMDWKRRIRSIPEGSEERARIMNVLNVKVPWHIARADQIAGVTRGVSPIRSTTRELVLGM